MCDEYQYLHARVRLRVAFSTILLILMGRQPREFIGFGGWRDRLRFNVYDCLSSESARLLHPGELFISMDALTSKANQPLKYCTNSRHNAGLDTLLLLLVIHLLNARAPPLFGYTFAADHLSLSLPHTSIDVNVLSSDPQWAV